MFGHYEQHARIYHWQNFQLVLEILIFTNLYNKALSQTLNFFGDKEESASHF